MHVINLMDRPTGRLRPVGLSYTVRSDYSGKVHGSGLNAVRGLRYLPPGETRFEQRSGLGGASMFPRRGCPAGYGETAGPRHFGVAYRWVLT
jgi:hypothetical protein